MRQVQRRVVIICGFVDKNYILVSLEGMRAVKKMSARIYIVIFTDHYKHNLLAKPFGYFFSCLGLFQMLSLTLALQVNTSTKILCLVDFCKNCMLFVIHAYSICHVESVLSKEVNLVPRARTFSISGNRKRKPLKIINR